MRVIRSLEVAEEVIRTHCFRNDLAEARMWTIKNIYIKIIFYYKRVCLSNT